MTSSSYQTFNSKGISQLQVVFIRRWFVAESLEQVCELAVVWVTTAYLVAIHAQHTGHPPQALATHLAAKHDGECESETQQEAEDEERNEPVAATPQFPVEFVVPRQEVVVDCIVVLTVKVDGPLFSFDDRVFTFRASLCNAVI